MSASTRIRTLTLTLTVANTASVSTANIPLLNGIVRGINIVAPALTSANYSAALVGPVAGMTLFNKASLSPNTTSNIPADSSTGNLPSDGIAVTDASNLVITTASAEGAARTFTATLLIER